jgi:predicted ATP-binding protein involved in virulence
MSELTSRRFSWLHLSDLRWSLRERSITEPQWQAFRRDLDMLCEDSGPWDAIFITGDIALTGNRREYEDCTRALKSELVSHLEKVAQRPAILAVPGNHDINRSAAKKTAEAKLLRFWTQDPEIKRDFWTNGGSYRRILRQAFTNFLDWTTAFLTEPKSLMRGLIPGDFSATLTTPGLKIGVVGLNTAFTELVPGTSKGRLALSSRQLDAVCNEDPDAWSKAHDFNILMTHHPPSWLEPESQAVLRANIAPPGRFLLHLCAGQHDSIDIVRLLETPTMLVQAPALGLDEESSGYISGSIDLQDDFQSITLRPRRYDRERRTYFPDSRFDPRVVDEYTSVSRFRSIVGSTRRLRGTPLSKTFPLSVERLELRNFRNFERLEIDFERGSSLPGRWTCLAGINGAGKSSILQALCLVLLGEPFVLELGGDRLQRMRRRSLEVTSESEIRAWINRRGHPQYVEIKIADKLSPTTAERDGYQNSMLEFWQKMRTQVVLAYGATRNLSDYRETRYSSLSPDVRRVMTLFDPLTQIASAEVLISESLSLKPAFWKLFERLVTGIFEGELSVRMNGGSMVFTFQGNSVEALDLPDGFRSSVAWLADLCSVWTEKHQANKGSLTEVSGIVLVDEIDLHLHPSLQRTFIPRLRKVLPKVQWIVTTHSPLVLSSFDSSEIVALDRDEPGGVRFLDRQIMGFSTDQIYDWLMETPPSSAVMEDKLIEEDSRDGPLTKESIARILEMSPDIDENMAKDRVSIRRQRLNDLKSRR